MNCSKVKPPNTASWFEQTIYYRNGYKQEIFTVLSLKWTNDMKKFGKFGNFIITSLNHHPKLPTTMLIA